MPRTLAEWQEYSEASITALIDELKLLGRRAIHSTLAAGAGWDEHQFSRWYQRKEGHPWHAVTPARHRSIVDQLVKDELLTIGVQELQTTDVVTAGLAGFFGYNQGDFEHAQKCLIGVYESYRYSYRLIDKKIVLRGLTEFWSDPDARVIRAREIYRIQKEEGISGSDVSFVREGLTICDRRAALPKVFTQKKDGTDDFQIMYLPERITRGGAHPQASQFIELGGFLVDWQGNDPYAAPVFLRRTEDKRLGARDGTGGAFVRAFHESNNAVKEYVVRLQQKFAVACSTGF